MSAVLPCLRLYLWLGRQLSKLQTSTDNPYAGGWLMTFLQYAKGHVGRLTRGVDQEPRRVPARKLLEPASPSRVDCDVSLGAVRLAAADCRGHSGRDLGPQHLWYGDL